MSLAVQLGRETAGEIKQANTLLGRGLGAVATGMGNLLQRGGGMAAKGVGKGLLRRPGMTLAGLGLGGAAANEGAAALNQQLGGYVPHFGGQGFWNPNMHAWQQEQTPGILNQLKGMATKPVQSLMALTGRASGDQLKPQDMWQMSQGTPTFSGYDPATGQAQYTSTGQATLHPTVMAQLDRMNQQLQQYRNMGFTVGPDGQLTMAGKDQAASGNKPTPAAGPGGGSHITFSPVLQDPYGRLYKDRASIY